jgi:hypothetical protein|tara:strand:+ start:190 stop:558 length:369 start_codon:yes stop_codon:yes gene_type:complete
LLDSADKRSAGKNYETYGNESKKNGEKTSIKTVIVSPSDGHEKKDELYSLHRAHCRFLSAGFLKFTFSVRIEFAGERLEEQHAPCKHDQYKRHEDCGRAYVFRSAGENMKLTATPIDGCFYG